MYGTPLPPSDLRTTHSLTCVLTYILAPSVLTRFASSTAGSSPSSSSVAGVVVGLYVYGPLLVDPQSPPRLECPLFGLDTSSGTGPPVVALTVHTGKDRRCRISQETRTVEESRGGVYVNPTTDNRLTQVRRRGHLSAPTFQMQRSGSER